MWSDALMTLLGVFLLLPTLLPMLWVDWWWVRIWDFPRLQLAVVYLVVLALLLVFARHSWVGYVVSAAVLGALAYQASWIFPYLSVAPRQTLDATKDDAARALTILIANVLMSNRSADRFLGIVKRAAPDVLIIDEPDQWWATQLEGLDTAFPYHTKYPLANTYGLILYSKLPLVRSEVKFLLEPEIPSIHAVLTLRSGEPVQLLAVHPRPPRLGQDTEGRDAELILVGREAKASDLPSIVAGDLNDVGWSQTTRLFQQVSGLLDARRGRGLYATYNAHYPLLRYPLDHLFHSVEFRVRRLAVLEYFGSDHFPLLVELSYEPEDRHEQEAPRLTPEAREQAEEQLKPVERKR